ncbi:aquaporin [Mycoplasma aquilae ATCC BAA-1896]|uniref:aquaporin n=1 Tax=Mycoplasma aquilae TaxID=1312741 RepID=UPI003A881B4D
MEKYKMDSKITTQDDCLNTQTSLTKKQKVIEFFKELFSFFKLRPSKRTEAQKPCDFKTWIVHGISEFIGTILISLGLAGLSIYTASGAVAESYLLHPIIVGFYAGFIVVGFCLFVFLRWSCDLNPSVSLYRYLNGTNDGWYTTYKIFCQTLGAFVAGSLIYWWGSLSAKDGLISNAPIGAITAAQKSFVDYSKLTSVNQLIAAGSTWIFFIELVMTSILLFPIFSPNINNKYRDLYIMFIISLSVWMGLLGGTAAINPARGMAQQIPALFFEGRGSEALFNTPSVNPLIDGDGMFDKTKWPNMDLGSSGIEITEKDLLTKTVWNSTVNATIAMVLGDLFAPVFYLFVQGLTKTVVNPLVVNIIKFKNFRSQSMIESNHKK